ncbi:hypothetical protein PoB_002851700 [Plakobranchus ocellatus]|uniref:SPOC domain-containing protein n=1 Tax=Plakobranchus ocellatus TaxID=259542 RepID=A0AAV4A532_9GAST|nr:hypothetical protein PoB_002851700 [Plakobranchus ocellatus]
MLFLLHCMKITSIYLIELYLNVVLSDYAVRNVYSQERGEDGSSDESRHFEQKSRNSGRQLRETDKKISKGNKKRTEKSNTLKRDKDSECASSCGEEESYYEYKQRMLRKAEEEARKDDVSDRSGSSCRSRSSNGRDETKPRDDRTYSTSDRKKLDKGAGRAVISQGAGETNNVLDKVTSKKRSSTSSGPGQAEPARRSAAQDDSGHHDDPRGAGADADAEVCFQRGGRGNRIHQPERQRGPEAGDTADEVSDIESEMASSPRKAGLTGNDFDASDGFVKDNFEIDGKHGNVKSDIARGNTKKGSKDANKSVNNKLLLKSGRDGKSEITKSYNKISKSNNIKTKVADRDYDLVLKQSRQMKTHGHQVNRKNLTSLEEDQQMVSSKISPSWERVMDNAEGEETGGLQLNLDPDEQFPQRGDDGCHLTDKEDQVTKRERDSDSRGARLPHDPTEWAMYQSGRRVETTVCGTHKADEKIACASSEISDERAPYTDGARRQSSGKDTKNNHKRSSKMSNVSTRQVFSNWDVTYDTNESKEKARSLEDYPNELVKTKQRQDDKQDTSLKYECKPLFSSKITSIPMAKTGQNKYLNKQAAELAEVERRRQTESLTANLKDPNKRKGQYIKDLSPPEPVIRGFVGDSMSDEEDEDETYSRLGPVDDRAILADPDSDFAGPKDYVLARDVSVAVSSTSAMSQNMDVKHETASSLNLIDHCGSVGTGNLGAPVTDVRENEFEITTYRVLLDEDDIAARKTNGLKEIERLKREEEKSQQARHQLDDVRGKVKRKGSVRKNQSDDKTRIGPELLQDVHPSLREASSKQYRRDPESYYNPKYPRVDSEGSELEAAVAADKSGVVRHPQLKTPAPTHPETFAFRHSFVEEPTPKIFRPGIDDKNMIQTQLISKENSPPQIESPENSNKAQEQIDAEDSLEVKESHQNKGVSFKYNHHNTEQPQDWVDVPKFDESSERKITVNALQRNSRTEESEQTIINDNSNRESSNQAEMEIVGTRYLEREAARYARHHKAFDETPVVDYREFGETGTTLSVLSPCDRSGLPVSGHTQTTNSLRGETQAQNNQDHDSIVEVSHRYHIENSKDVGNELEQAIPRLSVNTPGPEYDEEDKVLRKLQKEKKMAKKPVVQNIQAQDEKINGEEVEQAGASRAENTDSQREIEELASPGEVVNDDVIPECEEKLLQEKARSASRSRSVTGVDLMDMYLGKSKSSSGATADLLKEFTHESLHDVAEESEPSPLDVELTIAPSSPTDHGKSSTAKEDEEHAEVIKKSIVMEESLPSVTDADTVKLQKDRKRKKKRKDVPARRESVTATNLMDMWLGGEKAKQTRERMDQVMHHVSSEADSSYEHLPGLDDLTNRAEVSSVHDKGDIITSGFNVSSEQGDYNNTAAKDGEERDADTLGKSISRRDNSYHADDDDSETSASKNDVLADSSIRPKKVTKNNESEEDGAKVNIATASEVDNDVAVIVDDFNSGAISSTMTPSRKDSVPEVFIIATDGTKTASSFSHGDSKSISLPAAVGVDAIDFEDQNIVAKTVSREITEAATDKHDESAANDIGDRSSAISLVECLEGQLDDFPHSPTINRSYFVGEPQNEVKSSSPENEMTETVDSSGAVAKASSDKAGETMPSQTRDEIIDNEINQNASLLNENMRDSDVSSFVAENNTAEANNEVVEEKGSEKKHNVEESPTALHSQAPERESLTSFDGETETISGEDEDDAARRYVDKILKSVILSSTDDQLIAPLMRRNLDPPTNSIMYSSAPSSKSIDEIDLGVGTIAIAIQEENGTELQRPEAPVEVSHNDSNLVKGSSLQSPGSEQSERRRQRKLTVSFAVDEPDPGIGGDSCDDDSAGNKSRTKVVEIPWEAADEEEKEDEYERLERELERSLKVHR